MRAKKPGIIHTPSGNASKLSYFDARQIDSHLDTHSGINLPEEKTPYRVTFSAIRLFLMNQRLEKTAIAYEKDLRDFFQFIKESDLKSIGKIHLVAFRHHIEKTYEKTSVSRKLACLKSFFRFCLEEDYIEKNPAIGLKCPGGCLEGKTPEFTDEEVVCLFEAVDLNTPKGVRDRTMFELLFHLGLRVSELVSIRVGDFYKDRDKILLKITGKGAKIRYVPLQPRLIKWIEQTLSVLKIDRRDAKSPIFTPQKNPHDGNTKKAITARSVWVLMKQYAKKAGIYKRVTPHSGRVTATGNALDNSAGLIEITEMMGWSSIKMCQKYDRRRKKLINSATFKISYEK